MLQGTGLHTPDESREQTVRRLVGGPAHARRVSVRSAGGKLLADAAPVDAGTYRPRAAEATVLHRVVRDNLKHSRARSPITATVLAFPASLSVGDFR